MKKILFLFTTLIFTIQLFSQQSPIDSLAQLPLDASPVQRAALYHSINKYLGNINSAEEKLALAQQYETIASARQDSLYIGNSYSLISIAYRLLEDSINSQVYLDKYLNIINNYGLSLDLLSQDHLTVLTSLNIFYDKSGNITFDQIQQKDSLFGGNNTNNQIEEEGVYWVKLVLRGREERTDNFLMMFSQWLHQGWQNIDTWFVQEDGSIDKQVTGLSRAKEKNEVDSPFSLLRYQIKQQEKAILYVRLEGMATERNRKQDKIIFEIFNEEMNPGLFNGYPFKGHFIKNYPGIPYRMNMIFTHEVYEDSTRNADINHIAKHWNSLNAKAYYTVQEEEEKVYWLKMRFYGSTLFSGEQILQIEPFVAWSFPFIDAYIPDKAGGFTHQRTGNKVPLSERPYDFWAHFIRLDIQPSDTLDVFIRVEGVTTGPDWEILLFHVDKSSLFPSQVNEAWGQGIFYGILGIQCLYFLLLFMMEKERIHLYFVLLAFGLFLILGFGGADTDIYYKYVPFPNWNVYHTLFYRIGVLMFSFGLSYFTLTYFNTPKDSFYRKKLVPILLLLLTFSLLLITIVEAMNFMEIAFKMQSLSPILFLGIILSVILIALRATPQKVISKKYFFVAFSPLLFFFIFLAISYLIVVVFNYDLFSNTQIEFIYPVWQFTIVLMLTLLALSSGHRTNAIKAAQLAEQKSLNQAISRFVPNEFLSALGKTNITDIQLGDSMEKEVTVFFSDIRAYTTLSEQMTPTENFEFVNAYNARMGPIIRQSNGFINQYLGDGIMAIFPDSPTDALRASIQMQQVLQTYNLQRIQAGRKPIQVGMGMHTGSLIMGITGDADRLDAATIADSVNSAARIENLTKYYGASILLSEACLAILENRAAFNMRYLGQVQVKGKLKAIKIYECFDGDVPKMKTLKLATLSEFEKGIAHYFSQSFDLAQQAFEKVLQQNPADKTTQLFLTKTKWLAETGVTADWTGVELMEKQ